MSGVSSFLQSSAAATLGRVLIDFIWQGALVAALLGVALVALRDASSRLRYALCCAALLVMLLIPVVSFVIAGNAVQHVAPPPGVRYAVNQPLPDAASPIEPPPPVSPYLGAVSIAWLFGVCLLSLRLLGGRFLVTRLASGNAPSDAWQAAVEALRARFGLRRVVRVYESARVKTALSYGWLRPVILLPLQALSGLSREEIEAVIAHELAHVVRADYLVNLFQSAAETLLFYHPAVWWVSAQIRHERERCCDEMVVNVLGRREVYARALLQLEQARTMQSPSLAANGGDLRARIEAILGRRPQHVALPSLAGIGLFALLACSLAFGLSQQADKGTQNQPPKPSQKSSQSQAPAGGVAGGVVDGVPGGRGVVGGVPGGGGVVRGVPGGGVGVVGGVPGGRGVVGGVPGGVAGGVVRGVPGGVPGGVKPRQDVGRTDKLQSETMRPFQRWLNEEVVYIITQEEREAFEKLTTAEEREYFIEQFWKRRDPTPGTDRNEFKEEHYRRIAYANERFATGLPGWRTDRGRIYIMFGPPDEIESHPSGSQGKQGAAKRAPYEKWLYHHIEGIGDEIVVEFVDAEGTGDYRIVPSAKP